MTQELVTFTIRYRATKEEAQALMEDERARVLSWDDVFVRRDAAEADRKAFMEALKPFAKFGAEPPQPGFITRDVHISYLREAAKLMDCLRSEAEGKGKP
ncbi:hypothetical protein M5E06_17495 [Azospirillum sp. A1-3]|uniref:hypothetical protein n=1 Tax=Azospirillum sp. A1-3 TaxID=185874 RepID=UPI00207738BA|nr:hypothetical protein [Azospirillum sp. A1-3]MCM8735931.1 hypothetical protein [Azospirillum sp. A1-3]